MTAADIQILLNGEHTSIPGGSTIASLLVHLGLDRRRVAVEHNRRVIPRSEHANVAVAAGDQVEIVTFVGGGKSPC